jgi:hypothetical protein
VIRLQTVCQELGLGELTDPGDAHFVSFLNVFQPPFCIATRLTFVYFSHRGNLLNLSERN